MEYKWTICVEYTNSSFVFQYTVEYWNTNELFVYSTQIVHLYSIILLICFHYSTDMDGIQMNYLYILLYTLLPFHFSTMYICTSLLTADNGIHMNRQYSISRIFYTNSSFVFHYSTVYIQLTNWTQIPKKCMLYTRNTNELCV